MNFTHQELVRVLQAAKEAALQAETETDGGTVNMDSVVIRCGRKRRAYEKAAQEAGVAFSVRPWRTRLAMFLHLGKGDGSRNTLMSEAAHAVLTAHGLPALMYYRMD